MTSVSTEIKQHFKAVSLLFHAKLSLCGMFASPVQMLSRRVSDLEAGCNLLPGVLLLQESALIFVGLSSTATLPCFNDFPVFQEAPISEQRAAVLRTLQHLTLPSVLLIHVANAMLAWFLALAKPLFSLYLQLLIQKNLVKQRTFLAFLWR